MKIVLYTTHCPMCNVQEKKLKAKNIVYEEVTDVDVIKSKGFLSVPILEVNGKFLLFKEANEFINTMEEM